MRAIDLAGMIDATASEVGVDPSLLRKVVLTGENFDRQEIPTDEISPKRARGVAQVTETNFASLQRQGKIPAGASIDDPATNLRAGALILKEGLDSHAGNPAAAVAHYNGGFRNSDAVAAGRTAPSPETRNYLRRTGMTDTTDLPLPFSATDPRRVDLGPQTTKTTTSSKIRQEPLDESRDRLDTFEENNRLITDLLQGIQGEQRQTTETLSNATLEAGTAEAAQLRAMGDIEVAKLQKAEGLHALMQAGFDGQDAFTAAQKRRAEARYTMDTLKPKIDEENNVMIWDDPLRWAINQFTLPVLKQTYNAANQTEFSQAQYIQKSQALEANQLALDPGYTVEQLKMKFATAAQVKVLEAAKQAAIVRDQGLHSIASNYMQQAALSNSSQNAHEAWLRAWDENQRVSGLKEEDIAVRELLGPVNFQRDSLKLPRYNVAEFKRLRPNQQEDLIQRSKYPHSMYGNSLGDTLQFLDSQGALSDLSQTQPALHKMLSEQLARPELQDKLQELRKDTKFNTLPQAAQQGAALDAMVEADLQEARKKGYDRLKASSPLAFNIGTAVQYKELANNPFMKDAAVLLAAKRFGERVTDREMILTAVGKVQATKQDLPKIAKELSDYYRTGQQVQWATNGGAVSGIPRPQEYFSEEMMNDGKRVNLWNLPEVEHWLMKRAVVRADASSRIDLLNQQYNVDAFVTGQQ
jgi:hypothetical protein